MNIRIDNYYINIDKDNYVTVYIDGQLIIYDRIISNSRSLSVSGVIDMIENYNDRHELKWNEYRNEV